MGEILIIVFTGVVAVSTGAYAYLTWKLVSETQKLRRAQTEPRVSVYAELNEQAGNGRMDLVFENEGSGHAEDIKIGFEGDPTYFDGDRPIDQLPAIKNGLKHLGPYRRFRIILGWLFGEDYERAIQKPWIFNLEYKNAVGDSISEKFVVDFSQFAGLILVDSPLVKIDRHLESIRKDVHHLLTGFNKPRIITQTVDDYRKEQEQLIEQRSGATPTDPTSDTENKD